MQVFEGGKSADVNGCNAEMKGSELFDVFC